MQGLENMRKYLESKGIKSTINQNQTITGHCNGSPFRIEYDKYEMNISKVHPHPQVKVYFNGEVFRPMNNRELGRLLFNSPI